VQGISNDIFLCLLTVDNYPSIVSFRERHDLTAAECGHQMKVCVLLLENETMHAIVYSADVPDDAPVIYLGYISTQDKHTPYKYVSFRDK